MRLPLRCIKNTADWESEQAVLAFFDYFRKKHKGDKLYISVSLENTPARKMYASVGFMEVKEVEYTFLGKRFREIQMVKEW